MRKTFTGDWTAKLTVPEGELEIELPDFYRAHGFIEVVRGETRLTTGRSMECVFMRKELSAVTP